LRNWSSQGYRCITDTESLVNIEKEDCHTRCIKYMTASLVRAHQSNLQRPQRLKCKHVSFCGKKKYVPEGNCINLSIRGITSSGNHLMKIIPILNLTISDVPDANFLIE